MIQQCKGGETNGNLSWNHDPCLLYTSSAFYCGKLVLASSTYDGGLFPPMKAFLEHLQAKGFRSRRVGLMENGS